MLNDSTFLTLNAQLPIDTINEGASYITILLILFYLLLYSVLFRILQICIIHIDFSR